MKQKIIFKTLSFPRISETFIVSNISQAIESGYEIEVIAETINSIKNSSQDFILKKYKLMDLVSSVNQPKNKIYRFILAIYYLFNPINLYFFIKYILIKQRLSLSYIFIINFYKKYRDCNVFHIHFANASEDVTILKKIGYLKANILLTMHGYDAYFANDSEKKILQKKYKNTFENVVKVFINTSYLRDKVLDLKCPENKIEIVPIGIDVRFYTPNIHPKTIKPKSKIKLVSVGRLIELKGHIYGIDTVKLLVDKGYNVNYTIIGEGKYFNKLKEKIKKLRLENYVTLYGKGTQEEVKAILEESHIFLMVSIKDESGREEAQGLVTAEAQSMGLPIVGFRSGGIPKTVSIETSILVDQKNTNALCDGIIDIITTNNKFETMSLASRKWIISNFGLEVMIKKYYKDII